MNHEVKLGYAVTGDHDQVEIPIRHMVVAGQTQEAGKTTTLEALVARSGKTAIAFVTKRGEGSFAGGRRVDPYFRERADWQFVASILEAAMRERMKFERNWIIRVSKGAKTLREVHANVKRELLTARGINEGVYTTLDAYFDIVVPRIARVKFAPSLELQPGLNVLDLSDRETFPSELQGLVMRSVLEWVYEKCHDTITIIPEAWEFIPQARGSPVKLAAVELIRKGAGLRNYVWLDSQDIGGVDKEILRSCPVWLLGVQREANEIKRVLGNIPDGLAKPKPAAIATLERGQFFACFGKHAIKTYVQPAWMSDSDARRIATGELDAVLAAALNKPPRAPLIATAHITKGAKPETTKALGELAYAAAQALQHADPIDCPDPEDDLMSSENGKKLDQIIELLKRRDPWPSTLPADPPLKAKSAKSAAPAEIAAASFDEEQLFNRFRARLIADPGVLAVLAAQRPELEVRVERVVVEVDAKSAKGMVGLLLAEGFFEKAITASAAWKETQRRWDNRGNSARVYEQCDWYVANGFLTKENDGYQAVAGMKARIVEK